LGWGAGISTNLAGCYTTDLFTARAKKWIVDQRATKPKQPFFLYLAYDTPHAKLQLLPGEFPSGRGLKGGVQWIGESGRMINTATGKPDSYMHPDYANATWDHDKNSATPEQPWPDVYKRYATDVRRIDDCVGDLMQLLKDLKIDDKTLVVFTTDNGPSRESYLPENYEPTFFNSFGPFDGIKRDCWEGGVRVGALVRWPKHAPANRVNDEPSQSQDWMPTFAELAGVPAPARCDGVSLMPTITGKGYQWPSDVYVEYSNTAKTPDYDVFEAQRRGHVRQQMQLIRIGDFVGVRYNVKAHSDPFEIYDVVHDPKETKNLAGEKVGLERELHDWVLQLRRPDSSAKRPYDREMLAAVDLLSTASKRKGVVWTRYSKPTPWLAKIDHLSPQTHGIITEVKITTGKKGDTFLWEGYLRVEEDGEYTFTVPANTTGLLRIHQCVVIDCGFKSIPQDVSGSILLKKGLHPFRFYWRKTTDSPGLEMSGPSMPKQAIPAKMFIQFGDY
jgi:arylsulfatase A-like enzyme